MCSGVDYLALYKYSIYRKKTVICTLSTNKSGNMLTYVFPRGINMEFFIQKTSLERPRRLCVESCTQHCRVSIYRGHAIRYMAPQYCTSVYNFIPLKGLLPVRSPPNIRENTLGWNVFHSKERHTYDLADT
jgi:hypothetical protein